MSERSIPPPNSVLNNRGIEGVDPGLSERIQKMVERFRDGQEVLEQLLQQVASPIREGRWGSWLIEGRSARLPGLVMAGVAKRYAQEHDMSVPNELYIKGGRSPKYTREGTEEALAIQGHIERIKPELGRRTVVFTEYIQLGWSLVSLCAALKREGVAFDIAAVEADFSADEYRETLGSWLQADTEIFIGGPSLLKRQGTIPHFYNATQPDLQLASGVEAAGTELVAAQHAPGAMVDAAYAEARALQDQLYEKYFRQQAP